MSSYSTEVGALLAMCFTETLMRSPATGALALPAQPAVSVQDIALAAQLLLSTCFVRNSVKLLS